MVADSKAILKGFNEAAGITPRMLTLRSPLLHAVAELQ